MAKKERQKRSARKARQKERAELEALHAASSAEPESKPGKKLFKAESSQKKNVEPKKAEKNDKKDAKEKGRLSNYFSEVRSEMKRVSWPGKKELRNYSVAVIVTLIVTGIVIWLVDLGFVNLFNLYTNLRGL